MFHNINTTQEKIYIIQPITLENAEKYKVLHEEALSLIESAGAVYAGTIYQKIREKNPSTYIGEGKLQELYERLYDLEDITVLFNGDLTPSQISNISLALGNKKVIDRTVLILDIFAKNAVTNEGKLQVELAQLKYVYPRLKGKGDALSRLGGGVGTRGPGETKLEMDRRYIRTRLKYLETRLKELEKRRLLQTERRQKNAVKTIALVGYTNTGKSTLLNLLTGANVYVKNELFATLDPTAKKFTIGNVEFILIDTVGFLQELPHNLIEAFKSTLESALHADLALIVCDGTGEYEMQFNTTLQTLSELGFSSPYLHVMNKCEDMKDFSKLPMGCIPISAKENMGIEDLKREIWKKFNDEFCICELLVPYEEMKSYSKLKKYLAEQSISYNDDCAEIKAAIPYSFIDRFQSYIKK